MPLLLWYLFALNWVSCHDPLLLPTGRSFQDYGEAVLKHLENVVDSDLKLVKAPINYEGVSCFLVSPAYE